MSSTFLEHYIYAQLIGFILIAGISYILERKYFSNSKKPNKIIVVTIGLAFILISILSLIFSVFFFQYTEANIILRIFLGLLFLMGSLTFMLLGVTIFLTIKKSR